MTPVRITYPGIGNVVRWSYVRNRGIAPGVFILETVPTSPLSPAPATLSLQCGDVTLTFPDMVATEESLHQANRLRGQKTPVHLLDHRWRWKFGKISGRYNVRLADGTVDPDTARTPAQLASLCLVEMGEAGFDVSRMPVGMWPPAQWDNANPAECLDKLCRYVACEVTGGELGQVVIWPLGTGNELPLGNHVNEPYTLTPQNKPREIRVCGGPTVFQSRLKLAAVARNADTSLPLTAQAPYAANVNQSPFSFPDISTTQQRTDAFQSVYKWFYTKFQADGTHNLPLCFVPILKGSQYKLLPHIVDSWLNPDLVRIPVIPGVLGKFWPYGNDADECTSIINYNGEFWIDAARNLVTFPYPIWNLDSTGNLKAPELYLNCAYNVMSPDGSYDRHLASLAIGGDSGTRVLNRPEIFYSVVFSYNDSNVITGNRNTIGQANAEAAAYLAAFARIYTDGEQREIEWGGLKPISLDGRIAQLKLWGGMNETVRMRGSRMFEGDVFGPTAQEQRRARFTDSWLEGGSCAAT